MKYAALNINFDSLGEMYGFPSGYRDVSFTEVSKRFFALSDKYNFKYSIYVIGKDLEKDENRSLVREWADRGHEIGNHSWSHPLNLGAMKSAEIRTEILKAHDIITKATGREPRGFIAPGWSASAALIRELIQNKYLYDTSVFPSWLLYLSSVKMLLNHVGGDKFMSILNRKDWAGPWRMPLEPYFSSGNPFKRALPSEKSILILPLPCAALRTACWHTTRFVFGARVHKRILRSALNRREYFYYLTHPGDLLDQDDLDSGRSLRMERILPPLAAKEKALENAVLMILQSGRKIVTMRELAQEFIEKHSGAAA